MTCVHPSPLRSYTLPDLLESDVTVVLNTREDIVTVLIEVTITVQHRVTTPQMNVVLALLEAHPHACSFASLYAALTGVSPHNAEEFLQVAEDYVHIAMRPVRLVLKECRAILASLNLGVQPGEGTTYRLFRLER